MCRAAVRFDNLAAATAAVDALDGRYFAERSLVAEFDDGALSSQLPRGSDTARQQRYGFGEMAAATQDSIRVLQLASAEGAPFIACETFVVKVDHYTYKPAAHAPGGAAGYYRDDDAPPPDPHEQSRAILLQARSRRDLGATSARPRRDLGAISARSRRDLGAKLPQASDAGAAFIACAEFVADLPLYDWRDGPEGVGYYRHVAAPPAADPREQSLLVLREAAAAGAEFVRCPEDVGSVVGYDFRDGAEGVGYYRRPDAPDPDEREYMTLVLPRASAAGAAFVGCPEEVQPLPGYDYRDGAEGRGYYRRDPPPAPAAPAAPAGGGGGSYDAFMESMKELGAINQ